MYQRWLGGAWQQKDDIALHIYVTSWPLHLRVSLIKPHGEYDCWDRLMPNEIVTMPYITITISFANLVQYPHPFKVISKVWSLESGGTIWGTGSVTVNHLNNDREQIPVPERRRGEGGRGTRKVDVEKEYKWLDDYWAPASFQFSPHPLPSIIIFDFCANHW